MSVKIIALVAHDSKKADLVAFATFNREKLNVATADLIISTDAL